MCAEVVPQKPFRATEKVKMGDNYQFSLPSFFSSVSSSEEGATSTLLLYRRGLYGREGSKNSCSLCVWEKDGRGG